MRGRFFQISGMSAGLHYLHASQVVHGDIKGHNILLGPDLRPLFCDFGISKLQGDGGTSTNTKNAGSTKHMSPETLVEGASKDFASDVYAFGITIFEVRNYIARIKVESSHKTFPAQVLAATVPLKSLGANVVEIILAVRDGARPAPPFEPASREGEDFSDLWSLAAACWQTVPECRPDASEILATARYP